MEMRSFGQQLRAPTFNLLHEVSNQHNFLPGYGRPGSAHRAAAQPSPPAEALIPYVAVSDTLLYCIGHLYIIHCWVRLHPIKGSLLVPVFLLTKNTTPPIHQSKH